MRQDELGTLRNNLKRARKLLASSPRHLRPERQAEVERLVLAVKRAESSVNSDKREKVEQEALNALTREERQKRQKGKKAFWLKKCGSFHYHWSWLLENPARIAEKKKLLLKARYDAMAAEGGKRAVKKAIEKKRKKLSQTETKSRPFSRNTGMQSTSTPQPPRKRRVSGDGGARANKRQKSA
jgi:ribosomal RNA-processing protein 36